MFAIVVCSRCSKNVRFKDERWLNKKPVCQECAAGARKARNEEIIESSTKLTPTVKLSPKVWIEDKPVKKQPEPPVVKDKNTKYVPVDPDEL